MAHCPIDTQTPCCGVDVPFQGIPRNSTLSNHLHFIILTPKFGKIRNSGIWSKVTIAQNPITNNFFTIYKTLLQNNL